MRSCAIGQSMGQVGCCTPRAASGPSPKHGEPFWRRASTGTSAAYTTVYCVCSVLLRRRQTPRSTSLSSVLAVFVVMIGASPCTTRSMTWCDDRPERSPHFSEPKDHPCSGSFPSSASCTGPRPSNFPLCMDNGVVLASRTSRRACRLVRSLRTCCVSPAHVPTFSFELESTSCNITA